MPCLSARRMPLPRSAASIRAAALALARSAGGADRRRHGAGRHRQRDARHPGPERRRARRAGSSGAGRRLSSAMPARPSRSSSPRPRRPRATRAELVAVDYEPRDPVTDVAAAVRSRRAATLAEAPGNIALDWHGFGGDASAPRSTPLSPGPRMSRGSGSSTSASSWRRWSRAARWRATTARAAATSCPAPRRAPLCCGRTLAHCMGVAAGAHPGPERRCRRRLRHARDRLSGIPGAARRGAADRPAGALAGEPLRGVSDRQPGARHDHRGGAGARTQTGGFSRSISTCSPIWAPT